MSVFPVTVHESGETDSLSKVWRRKENKALDIQDVKVQNRETTKVTKPINFQMWIIIVS